MLPTRLLRQMDGADRLSLTFRFEDGTTTPDAGSQANLADLAQMLEAGLFKGKSLILAGFSDSQGSIQANFDLSQGRADAVMAALKALVPGLPVAQLPVIEAFGGGAAVEPAGRGLGAAWVCEGYFGYR